MKYLQLFETYSHKVTIGLDIDGTISNFSEAYNALYKQYFPDKEVVVNDDWYWYQKMDYNGVKPNTWFSDKKAEVFDLAQPFPDAVNTINNIYDFIKTYGYTLNIVSNQPTQESKDAAKIWVDKYGFKYDNIIFVDTAKDKWNYVDIMIDDADKVIGSKPLSKVCIKVEQVWNTKTEGDITIPSIKNLTIDVIKTAVSRLKNNIIS